MKIFIDSADLDEIQQGFEWGVVDGVTTNPSLLKKAVEKRTGSGQQVHLKEYIANILEVAKGTPVSLEVTEYKAEKMIEQGKRLYDLFNPVAGNVNIKIPIRHLREWNCLQQTLFRNMQNLCDSRSDGALYQYAIGNMF